MQPAVGVQKWAAGLVSEGEIQAIIESTIVGECVGEPGNKEAATSDGWDRQVEKVVHSLLGVIRAHAPHAHAGAQGIQDLVVQVVGSEQVNPTLLKSQEYAAGFGSEIFIIKQPLDGN